MTEIRWVVVWGLSFLLGYFVIAPVVVRVENVILRWIRDRKCRVED